jgi:threonine dehydrogenase-like Zn-dependent dehydrogenase
MKALYYDGAGALEWRDDPEPDLQAATDALVRPVAASTCDLDQAIIHGSVPGSEQPFAIGHEGVGEVVAVGDAVTGVRPGDLVVIPYHLACGTCDRCREELPLYCRETAAEALAVYGIPVGADYGGIFSELVRVPFADYALATLPPSVEPLDAVSVGDNLTDAYRCIALPLRQRPGSNVLIMSGGSIGVYAADIARACGARHVTFVDVNGDRRALAEGLGATAFAPDDFDPAEREHEIALVSHSSAPALRNALLAAAPAGHVENLGFHFTDPELPVLAMHFKCVTFRSALSNARPLFEDVLALIASGRVNPRAVQTAVLPFDEAAEGLPAGGFKPVVVRD